MASMVGCLGVSAAEMLVFSSHEVDMRGFVPSSFTIEEKNVTRQNVMILVQPLLGRKYWNEKEREPTNKSLPQTEHAKQMLTLS